MAALGGLLVAGAFCVPALGAPGYTYDQPLTEKLSSEVVLVEPWTLSFDASGDLFLADPHGGTSDNSIVDEFDASGTLRTRLGDGILNERARGVAVSDETGHVYSTPEEKVVVMGSNGEQLSVWHGASTPLGEFGTHIFAAVDNSGSVSKGELYVYTEAPTGGEVDVFRPKDEDKEEGEYVRQLTVPGGFDFSGSTGAAGIAVVDRSGPEAGEVYVADPGHEVVDRFSATGAFEVQLKGPPPSEANPSGGFQEPVSVAVDETTGDVLVVDRGARAVDEFSASGQFLGQITQAAPGEAFERPVAVAIQRTGAGEGDVYVSDEEKKRVDVFAVEPPGAPEIRGEGVSDVSADSATFEGELNPHGLRSTYSFQYGPCSSAATCASSPYPGSVPVPEGALGEAGSYGFQSIGPFHVQDVAGGTLYHYRLLAINSDGTTPGEERTFTTQGQSGELALLDGRAWELVSPPDKHGASLLGIPEDGILEAAADGGAFSYLANAPTEESPPGDSGYVQVLSTRGPGGWSSRDIASPHEGATGIALEARGEYRYFSADLESAIVQPSGLFNPALSSEASEQSAYLRTLGDCESDCYRPLVSAKAGAGDVAVGTRFGEEALCEEDNGINSVALPVCGPEVLGASANLGHVVLAAEAELTPGAGREQLYEWSDGQLQLISMLPANGAGEELPAPAGSARLGANIGISGPGGQASRAVSADGSLVFWESQSEGRLLVRDTALGRSAQLDLAEAACVEKAEGCESGGGRFDIASSDGSRVFFTDSHKLTKDAGAKSEEPDLYECRILASAGKPSCELTDLTPASGGENADVQGDVLGAGEDGQSVYFVADGRLGTAGAQRGTCVDNIEAQPAGSECDLYVSRDGTVSLVTRLSGVDRHDWGELSEQAARVAPNGEWLAFMSERSLPTSGQPDGYDNRDAVSGQPDAEVYLYDAAARSLACGSCDPSGARPVGVEYRQLASADGELLASSGGVWEGTGWVAAVVPRSASYRANKSAYQGRFLSDEGRLFFNSLDALVSQDVNDNWDVYEHEPAGLGSCAAGASTFDPTSGGCTDLISSGSSSEESAFIDASESGSDVFFITAAQLTSEDVDHDDDIYDAHECTGASPCIPPPPVSPPPCTTEASCKASPTLQPPIFGAPPSATFNGLGNISPPTPAKPKAKPLTRAQKLAAALKACRGKKSKQTRKRCEASAKKNYGTTAKKTKKSNRRAK